MLIFYLFLALLIGVLAGTFSGLMPGIHINLISALLIALIPAAAFLSNLEPIVLVVFLVAMAITHTFIDYIPSVLLGAPDEDTFLSILPGHQMLIEGRAYNAIIYTLYGSLAAIFIILLLSPVYIFVVYKISPYVQRIMPYILITASAFLIYSEKKSRLWALIIFLLSGFIGIASFNLPNPQPLLPLFTGLFGVSSLLTSIMKKQKIPKQEISLLKKIKLKMSSFLKAIFASLIASPLCSFLPGMGSGQAAVIGCEVVGSEGDVQKDNQNKIKRKSDLNQKEFLVLLGAINTIVMGLSFLALYAIGKARTGVAVAVSQLIELTKLSDLGIILTTILLAGIFSFFLAILLAKISVKYIHKVNYVYLSTVILFILIAITSYFSGIYGLIVLFVSSALGLTAIRLGIRRTHLMGALLVPIILIYLL